MTKPFRSRLFFCLLYPDNPDHASALETIKKTMSHVGIIHDKDVWQPDDELLNPEHKTGELKKAHAHVILKFGNARYVSGVAKDLGIDERFLEKCASFDKAGLYLLHDGCDDKYQYDVEELFGDLAPAVANLTQKEDECVRVKNLLALIDSVDGHLSFRHLIELACDKGLYGDLRRMGYMAKELVREHNEFEFADQRSEQLDKLYQELFESRQYLADKFEQETFG